jgi:hypothetical protein
VNVSRTHLKKGMQHKMAVHVHTLCVVAVSMLVGLALDVCQR